MATTQRPQQPLGAEGSAPVYTYRAGQKLRLDKRTDQFVVRALGAEMTQMAQVAGMAPLAARATQQVSSASTRVQVAQSELEAQMAAARKIAPTHHAYDVAGTDAEFLITDRVMVRFKPGTRTQDIDALIGRYSLVLKQRYADDEVLLQLTDHTAMNPVKLVVALTENEPIVALAENDLNQRMVRRLTLPTDALYLDAWHLHLRSTQGAFDPRASARCEQAWQLLGHFGSAEVVVAITDDGCRIDHADFDSGAKFAAWGYFQGERLVKHADPDALAQRMYQSGANHGTSCAGVTASEADGVMTVGAAPGCKLLPIKWQSDGASLFVSDSKLRSVLDWIADKADVMSNSWGIVPQNLFASSVTSRIAALSTSGGRRGRGIVFLWAAGNENCPIHHSANINVPYSDGWAAGPGGTARWVGVDTTRQFSNSLIGLPGVMHIAALASNAQRSHYSNYGSGIDLCAPSSNSHAYWRMQVPGIGVTAPTGEGQRFTLGFGGTSSATPLAAGIAALVISANPTLSATEVISLLRRTASKDLNMAPYPPTPSASFDPDPTWDVSPVAPFAQGAFTDISSPDGSWSPWFGFGKIDAERAVAAALAALAPATEPTLGSGLSARSQRVIDIPDNNATGIEDALQLGAAGTLASLTVDVDIRHPFIGDLELALIAPQGQEIKLHTRSGGNAQNIVRSYSSAEHAGLGALRGGAIAGNWRLRVRDVANADLGQLRGWAITAGAQGTQELVLEEAPGTTIPDNNPAGISRSLAAASPARIAALSVAIDITHTYIGDLRVSLVAPSGRSAVLHERSGGDTDNLIRDWTSAMTPALAAMIGESAGGNWVLQVADLDVRDLGKLNRWRLQVATMA